MRRSYTEDEKRINAILAERIHARRRAVGVSQGEVARAMGIDPSNISRIESGERSLRAWQVCFLIDILDWTYDDLFKGLAPERNPLPDIAWG